jgi:putative copper export protein
MTDPLGLALRVVHIFCGVFWAGAALMIGGFIEPVVKAMGPDGGKFMQRFMGERRFGFYMTMAAWLVVLSGLALFVRGSGGQLGSWFATGYGHTIVTGSIAGILALATGLSVNAPTAARMAGLARAMQAAGGPPKPEQLAEVARLQHRLHRGGLISATLLAISVLCMAAARVL